MSTSPDPISPSLKRPAIKWSLTAWILILLSIVLILFVGPALVKEEHQEIEDDQNLLAILKLQAKTLNGLYQLQPQLIANEVNNLDQLAISAQTNAAVAGLQFYLDPEGQGRERALELLSIAQDYNDENVAVYLQDLRQIIIGETSPERLATYESAPWFFDLYRLARSPSDAPERKQFDQASLRAAVAYVAALIVVLGCLVAGFVLLILALLKQRSQQITAFLPQLELDGLLLTGFALYLFIMAAGQIVGQLLGFIDVEKPLSEELITAVLGAITLLTMILSVVIGFLWPKWRGILWTEYRRRMGWHRGRGFFRETMSGLVGYLAMLPIFCIGIGGTLILGFLVEHFTPAGETSGPVSHPIVSQLAEGGIGVKITMFMLAAVMAPLFEETMFRGALYRALRGKWNFLLSGLVSGLIFAIVHPQGIVAVPALTAMGLGFAMIREWRDSLIAPMVAHSVHNGILVCAMIFAFS